MIAHELAHVCQWASGHNLSAWQRDDVEIDADDLAEDWGFSSTAMDEWDEEHGIGVPQIDGRDQRRVGGADETRPGPLTGRGR